MYKRSFYSVFSDLDQDYVLLYSTRTSEFFRLESSLFNAMEKGHWEALPDKTLAKLFEAEILVPEAQNEFSEIINDFKTASAQDSDILSYTIQPTANCQLGCNYCGQVHEKFNLSVHQSEKIYQYIEKELNKHTYKAIDVTWYGAEPLLGLHGIRHLSEKLMALSEEKNLTYQASMITNGLALKQAVFEELLRFNVLHYQITLDGIAKTHDKSRFTKKGNATYETILKNVVSAVKHPHYKERKAQITIRCNIHKDNYKEMDLLIDELHKLDIHRDITMDFAPIHDWGQNDADVKIGLAPDVFAALEIDWMMKLKQLGFGGLKDVLPRRTKSTCMVTSKQSELIDAKGRISYCWEVPYTPVFDHKESEFFIGNIKDAQNKKERKDLPLGDWYGDIEKQNHGTWCKDCKYLPVCGGSCPIHWYSGKPACPSFKYNFEDRMALQYLNEINYDFTESLNQTTF